MSIKEKLLGAIGELFPDDLSEEALLQILLDAYARSKQRITELERQQAGIQLAAQRDTEALLDERHRMRTDPTYHAAGEYFFSAHDAYGLPQKFVVRIAGRQIDLCERKPGYDMKIQQLSREDFLK